MLGLCALASATNFAESSFVCRAPALASCLKTGSPKLGASISFNEREEVKCYTIGRDCWLGYVPWPPPHRRHLLAPDYRHSEDWRGKTNEGCYKYAVSVACDLMAELGIAGPSWEQQLDIINKEFYAAKGSETVPATLAADAKGVGSWLVDSGSCYHLIGKDEVPDGQKVVETHYPITLVTANGEVTHNQRAKTPVRVMNKKLDTVVVGECPPVAGMGRLCIDDGMDFIWLGSRGEDPYLVHGGSTTVSTTGTVSELRVENYCPYLDDPEVCGNCKPAVTAACGGALMPALPYAHGGSSSSAGGVQPQGGKGVQEVAQKSACEGRNCHELGTKPIKI